MFDSKQTFFSMEDFFLMDIDESFIFKYEPSVDQETGKGDKIYIQVIKTSFEFRSETIKLLCLKKITEEYLQFKIKELSR